MKKYRVILSFIIILAVLAGCTNESTTDTTKKDLLIYCGITMIKPMKELAELFEKEHNCTITLNQGGSEDLYQSLKASKIGELYLPGSPSYRTKHKKDGFLKEYVDVGYNQAALIVQQGNPKNIPADIRILTDKKYVTVIGNPESCSIGQQSEKILTQLGLFDAVVMNSMQVAADSRTMNKTIIDKSADVILNWGATAYFEGNREYMDRLMLEESIAPKNRLQLTQLSFARSPNLAKEFMKFAVSTQGQEIFHKYGFLDQISVPGVLQK